MATTAQTVRTAADTVDLSIVIPAYQEASIIERSLEELARHLDAHPIGRVEVIVVVADSPDGTADLARRAGSRFADFQLIAAGPRAVKGRDVRLGMLAARGRYRLFMDADLATPLAHLREVRRLMDDGVAVAVAARDLRSAHRGLKRRLIAVIGNLLVRLALLPGLRDSQCGFKLFRADVCDAVFGRATVTGWGFDLEVLALAHRLGYRWATIAVPDWRNPKDDAAQLAADSAWGAALDVLRDLAVIRIALWRGRYDDVVTPTTVNERVVARTVA